MMLLCSYALYFIIFQLLIYFQTGNCQEGVFSRSNFGEYTFEWKYIGPCETGKGSNEIQINVKMTKKNRRLQILGNYTLLIPWDESISMHLNFMKLGSNSGWIKNSYLLTIAGCTQFKLLFPSGFQNYVNWPKTCPIPKGVYTQKEFDLDEYLKEAGALVPKTFFYGSYKIISDLKKKDKLVGCVSVAIDFKPKWQKRNRTL